MTKSSSVEKLTGLKRRIDVTVTAERVGLAYHQRLQKVAKTVKMDGFRPGKIPQKVVEQRFGKNILVEVADELMREHFVSAVEEHQLKIVGTPEVTPQKINPGEALQYSIECEVYPEVTLADMSQISLTRERVELTEADVDGMLEVLRKQQAEWVAVDRAAAKGDRVSIDFVGKQKGVPFEQGSAEGFTLELGSGRMIPGFEEAIVGKKAGDAFEISCTFPAEYARKELANQPATFETKLNQVLEARLPVVDDALAKRLGVEGGLAALRQEVRQSMQQQVDQRMYDRFKKQVLDKMLALNEVELPETLVNNEMKHIQEATMQRLGDKAKSLDSQTLFPPDRFMAQAKERVALGLILGEVIKQYHLVADQRQVEEKIGQMAALYGGGQPEQIAAWYQNERMLAEVQAMILENQAVDKLAEQMHIEDQVVSYEQAKKLSESDRIA